MDDLIKEFLTESNENLDRLDQELVKLESDPSSRELISSIFRTIHTIKGSCGFLGFARLEKVTHVGENLLSRLREGELVLTAEITSGLLAMVDAVRRMLEEIANTGKDGEEDYTELQQRLARLQQPEATAAPAAAGPGPSPTTAPETNQAAEPAPPPVAAPEPPPEPVPTAAVATEPVPADSRDSEAKPMRKKLSRLPEAGRLGGLLVERGHATADDIAAALDEQERGDHRRLGEILIALRLAKPEDVQAALQLLETRIRETAPETIRVGVNLLDKLMNLVGELVLARNQLLQFSNSIADAGFHTISQRMNLIATELQGEVMKTRMQPIGNIWAKFPRTVRDLALGCGKDVRIEMEGKQTELDKTIIEAIKDPLTHLVRNAVDHGLETPQVRVQTGKSSTGVLTLRAFHEGGQVNIEICDDGAGLNSDRIRKKAIERGLVAPEQASRMPDRDVFNLIFLPGFSTAEKVTNVSGRGVGMDVVKTNVEKIGGTVEIHSTAGEGTTVRIKIPLTLAIIPALVVTCGGSRFAIPQVALTELVSLEAGQATQGIEMVHGAPVYRLRERLLPLVYLREVLQTAERGDAGQRGANHLPDFAKARDKHHEWLARLKKVLSGQLSMAVEEAGSYTECALGKWLYGGGLEGYGGLPEVALLEDAHKNFHTQVREVVAGHASGQANRAQQSLQRVTELSQKVLQLLTSVEQRVHDQQNVNIVVLRADNRQFGLVVDEINDTEEIVVKPLRKQLKSVKTFAGASIMGDGRVALILDVMGLAQRASVVGEGQQSAARSDGDQGERTASSAVQTLLLFQPGAEGRMAIPLSSVARLEEFARHTVERAGRQEVVQYRGQILPLIRVAEILEGNGGASRRPADDQIPLQVVVYTEQGRSVGLVVEHILDIVEENLVIESPGRRTGLLGSAVVQQRVTDLLDVQGVVRSAIPEFFQEAAQA